MLVYEVNFPWYADPCERETQTQKSTKYKRGQIMDTQQLVDTGTILGLRLKQRRDLV